MEQPLLSRIAAGDRQAVAECLDRYGDLVWSLARRFCSDRAEAEDAVQDVFIDLWTHAARFDPEIAAEKTFVAMIARRRLIDRMRKRQRRPVTEQFDADTVMDAPTAHDELETKDEAGRAVRLLRTLKREQQQVLELSIYRGWSHGTIAEKLGLPLGTVKTHLRRGLMRIREGMRGDSPAAGLRVGP